MGQADSTVTARSVTVGVVALQGAFREHAQVLAALGLRVRLIKTPTDLDGVDAVVLPGGESTAQVRIAAQTHLMEALRERIADGMPALGTCAGLILLAKEVLDPAALAGFDRIGVLDVAVRRNAYGRQLASGERHVTLSDGTTTRGVFIRAPRIESVADGVEILARDGDVPVVVRSGNVIGCAFHPELTGDATLHRMMLAGVMRESCNAEGAGGLSVVREVKM